MICPGDMFDPISLGDMFDSIGPGDLLDRIGPGDLFDLIGPGIVPRRFVGKNVSKLAGIRYVIAGNETCSSLTEELCSALSFPSIFFLWQRFLTSSFLTLSQSVLRLHQ